MCFLCGVAGLFAATPKEKHAAIMRDYNAEIGIRNAKSEAERMAAVKRFTQFPRRLVRLAQEHPKDPIALNVLRQAIQAINSTDSIAQVAWEANESGIPQGSSDQWVEAAVDQLIRDHIRSPKLGGAIDRARYGYRPGFERFLRVAWRENPARENQAAACLALAQYLLDKSRMLQLVEDRPAAARAYEIIFGASFLATWKARGKAGLRAEAEALFERATEYEDVAVPVGNVGEVARQALYEIRNLSVGRPAPKTAGLDQDGVRFSLDDYRGKVVLLYFWMQFCPT